MTKPSANATSSVASDEARDGPTTALVAARADTPAEPESNLSAGRTGAGAVVPDVSATSTEKDQFTPLEDQIRELFGRAVYTHKTQEKEADACNVMMRRVKLGQIVLSAIAASGALMVIAGNEVWMKVATAIFSLLSFSMSAYMKGFDPGGASQNHHNAAASIWPIRESYLSLLTDLRERSISEADGRKRRDELMGKLAVIYKNVPRTGSKAYMAAQKALKKDEDLTFSDSEIDVFLPSSLKKSNSGRSSKK